LLQAAQTADLATTVRSLNADVISHDSTVSGMKYLQALFSAANALGARLAAQAVEGIADPDVVAASSSALANDLLREVSDIIAV
jgi:hypothetical protein